MTYLVAGVRRIRVRVTCAENALLLPEIGASVVYVVGGERGGEYESWAAETAAKRMRDLSKEKERAPSPLFVRRRSLLTPAFLPALCVYLGSTTTHGKNDTRRKKGNYYTT